MMRKAIEKINAEMQKRPGDRYWEAVGQHIIDRCTDERTAAAVLTEGKSLAGCMESIQNKAQLRAKNNVAVIAEDEVYAMAERYFGIEGEPPDGTIPAAEPAGGGLPDLADFL